MTLIENSVAKRLLDQATDASGQVDIDTLRELVEQQAIPEWVTFKYYLHDGYDFAERVDWLQQQVPQVAHLKDDHEIFQRLGRPFYEVTLNCKWNTQTGEVVILSAQA